MVYSTKPHKKKTITSFSSSPNNQSRGGTAERRGFCMVLRHDETWDYTLLLSDTINVLCASVQAYTPLLGPMMVKEGRFPAMAVVENEDGFCNNKEYGNN